MLINSEQWQECRDFQSSMLLQYLTNEEKNVKKIFLHPKFFFFCKSKGKLKGCLKSKIMSTVILQKFSLAPFFSFFYILELHNTYKSVAIKTKYRQLSKQKSTSWVFWQAQLLLAEKEKENCRQAPLAVRFSPPYCLPCSLSFIVIKEKRKEMRQA